MSLQETPNRHCVRLPSLLRDSRSPGAQLDAPPRDSCRVLFFRWWPSPDSWTVPRPTPVRPVPFEGVTGDHPLESAEATWRLRYVASRILAIAATCLPHSCVSVLSLFRP